MNDTTVFTAVDLLPTLCAAAGATLPADYRGDGENLLDALQGRAVTRTRPVFWQWLGTKTEPDWWPRLAVREGDWKLVFTDDSKRLELHRLKDDRAESVNVADDYPDVVARLTKLALNWKATLPEKPNSECVSTSNPAPSRNRQKQGAKPLSAADRGKIFQRWDTNQDDLLTLDEYQTALKGQTNLEQRFKSFDKDSDGKLTHDEFAGAAAK
jgi:arylsulfatase A-like enzyme